MNPSKRMQILAASCLFLLIFSGIKPAFSQQAITAISSTPITVANGATYTTTGAAGSGSGISAATTYQYNYGNLSGTSNNKVLLNNFAAASGTYTYDYGFNITVILNRVDNGVVTGQRDLLYNEGGLNTIPTPNHININAPYVASMATLFIGNDDLRSGTDNIFGNTGNAQNNNNNIERLDVRINTNNGYLIGNANNEGFAVFERGGVNAHDPFVVSIITSLDGGGNPNGYTGLKRLVSADYGSVNPIANADYIVLRRDGGVGNLQASAVINAQGIGGIFFRFADFGLAAGTKVYGYSLAGADLPGAAVANDFVNYNNATNFPTTTASASNGGIDFTAITGLFKIFNDDNDAILNSADVDDDNDGIPDLTENGGTDAFGDADSDGILNFADATPGAGIPSFVDSNGDNVSDAYDFDLDGQVNQIDLDSDNDGIPDIVEAGGIDTNGDGIIDGVLVDTDADGLANAYDIDNSGFNIANRDTDGDGIANFKDLDSDNDGIPDVVEVGGSDADNDGKLDNYIDTDSDGFADVVDGDVGNDGTTENTASALLITGLEGAIVDGQPDTYTKANADAAGLPNAYDLDADGDGILDVREAGLADTNNDGIADGISGTDGWSDTVDALGSLGVLNSDSDTKSNYLDIDTDDDGITDNAEGQSTVGFIAPSGLDGDADGIDDAYDNDDAAFAGNATNGLTPYNHDGADLPDYIDMDSDNDSNPDRREGNDWNGNGLPDENTVASGTDTDGDGLDDIFDLVVGPDVSIVGYGGAGSRSTAQQTPGAATNRDWRNQIYSLPVTLVSFGAEERNGTAFIRWVAEGEVNFYEYVVERSTNGRDFIAVGKVLPLNNGNRNNYRFVDNIQTINTVAYYRLNIGDIGGRIKYSSVVKIVRNTLLKKAVTITPNPATENLQIRITSDVEGTAAVQIASAAGQTIYQLVQHVYKGDNVMPVQDLFKKLAKGTYLVSVEIEGKIIATKFIF